jgi:hypothetical protein
MQQQAQNITKMATGQTRNSNTRRQAPVVAVHNEDKALCVLIVVAPKGADLVLATHIPNSEADVLVPNRNSLQPKKLKHKK